MKFLSHQGQCHRCWNNAYCKYYSLIGWNSARWMTVARNDITSYPCLPVTSPFTYPVWCSVRFQWLAISAGPVSLCYNFNASLQDMHQINYFTADLNFDQPFFFFPQPPPNFVIFVHCPALYFQSRLFPWRLYHVSCSGSWSLVDLTEPSPPLSEKRPQVLILPELSQH